MVWVSGKVSSERILLLLLCQERPYIFEGVFWYFYIEVVIHSQQNGLEWYMHSFCKYRHHTGSDRGLIYTISGLGASHIGLWAFGPGFEEKPAQPGP